MLIHKNWQELIRPTALEIKPGADPSRHATAVAEPLERGFGLTLGYQINDNLGLTFSYKSTASDQAPDDLQMDVFMISLVSGWHPIIEGSKRLQSE